MNITNSSTLHNTSLEDRHLTEQTCEVVAAVGAGLFYAVLFILVLLSTVYKLCPKPEAYKVLFPVGAAVLLLHIFTNDKYDDIDDLKVKQGFQITVNFSIGIITLLQGFLIFQKRPSLNCDRICHNPCDNPHHKDINFKRIKQLLPMTFVGSVTLVIIIMETVFLIKTSEKDHPMKSLILAGKSIFLLEKILQAIAYWLLCKTRCLSPDKVNEAKFYFKVMSFYNGGIWLDSMVHTENDLILANVQEGGPPWVNIFGTLYKACIIDYRMLFSLVFLEHDLALSNLEEGQQEHSTMSVNKSGFVDNLTNYVSFGSFLGCICCLLQLSCLANYVSDIHCGPWIHGLTIVANVFICVCCWKLMINLSASTSRKDQDEDSKSPHGLKIVLCCFGAVGLAYWFYAAVLVTSWAIAKHGSNDYFNWISAKYFFRCFTAFHLIYTFMQTNIENMTMSKIAKSKTNNFLIGCLMFGMLSEFLGSAVEQYVGPIEHRFK